MASFRYKEYSDDKFEIVGMNEKLVAMVERGEDNLWRILPKLEWTLREGFDFGPFATSEEAFEEIDAVQADQS